MKKIISFIGIFAIILSMSMTALAGSIPEDLLHEDFAQIFFAEVVDTYDSYDGTPCIEVIPVNVIKGDVKIGTEQAIVYKNPNTVGDFRVKKGSVYLFTYLDENNPTDIFEVTSYDTSTLKLKNVEGDMWERFNDYLNEGAYEMAEKERSGIGKQISFMEFLHEGPPLSSLEVKKVNFRYQDELHEGDVDEFEKVAKEIMIVNANDGILYESGKEDAYKTVLYIELLDENEQLVSMAAVSRFGEVDRYGLMMSRLMNKDYEMKTEDLQKLYSLFPKDVQKNIVAPEGIPVSEEPLELPDMAEKNYTPWLYGGAATVFVIAFLIGVAIKKRRG